MVGAPEPLDAIQDAVNLHGFDEIILSTLPKRVSRWLHLDLPSKLNVLGLPVTTVTASGPRRNASAPSLGGAVTPFLYWMQVLIVVCVLASIVIAIVKL